MNIPVIAGGAAKISSLLAPITWGVVFAYLMNPVLVKSESIFGKIFCKKKPHKKACRITAVTICLFVFLGLIAAFFAIILPQLILSIQQIVNNFQSYFTAVQDWVMKLVADYPDLNTFAIEQLNKVRADLSGYLNTVMPSIQTFMTKIGSGAWSIITTLLDAFIGIIIMIYLLFSKEVFIGQAKKISSAIFPKSFSASLIRVCSHTNEVMGGFINGKIIDSVLVGIICFIGMTIMKMDYVVLISVVIAITNIIPFFGPFIGAIPSGLLLLMSDPSQVIPFGIFILVLQQFDGNILTPQILGDSTGLSAFWVMVAIFLGEGLFGFGGMIIGVPLFAVLYTLIKDFVEYILKKKSLPVDTAEYMPLPTVKIKTQHKSFKLSRKSTKKSKNNDKK
jgi:predicted PurR-regulated permease PerM